MDKKYKLESLSEEEMTNFSSELSILLDNHNVVVTPVPVFEQTKDGSFVVKTQMMVNKKVEILEESTNNDENNEEKGDSEEVN